MPKKRKHGYDDEEDDDEEYRTSDDGDGNSKEDDDDDFVEKPTKKKPSAPSNKPFDVVDLLRRKKRQQSRKNDDDLSDDDDYDGDTTARMTENGGYAHTHTSKLRISKANKGNTPWNKVQRKHFFCNLDVSFVSQCVAISHLVVLCCSFFSFRVDNEVQLIRPKSVRGFVPETEPFCWRNLSCWD